MIKAVLSCVSVCLLSAEVVADQGHERSGFYVGVGGGSLSVRADNEDQADLPTTSNVHLQGGYSFSDNFSIEAQYVSSVKKADYVSVNQSFDLTSLVKQSLSSLYTSSQLADITSVKVNGSAVSQVSFQTASIFAAYRTSGNLYAKVKAGVSSTQMKLESVGKTSWDTGFSTTASAVIKSSVQGFQKDFDQGFQQSFNASAPNTTERDTNFGVGIGGGYKFSEKISAELEYTKFTEDVAYSSLSVNYSF